MTDELPPDPPAKDEKGRFLPGHKMARGRPKGSPNQFGPGFRERLMAGISRAGAKKARKNGVNAKVDGIEYYLEHLADTNGAATASIISKLIPPEAPPPETFGPPTIINVHSALSGNMWAPGHTLLLPYDECGEAHQAYRGGPKAWQAYLEKLKPSLPLEAFDKLCSVAVPPEPKPDSEKSPPLTIEHDNLVTFPRSDPQRLTMLESRLNNMSEPQKLAMLESRLDNMSAEEMRVLLGIFDGMIDPPDDAA